MNRRFLDALAKSKLISQFCCIRNNICAHLENRNNDYIYQITVRQFWNLISVNIDHKI